MDDAIAFLFMGLVVLAIALTVSGRAERVQAEVCTLAFDAAPTLRDSVMVVQRYEYCEMEEVE